MQGWGEQDGGGREADTCSGGGVSEFQPVRGLGRGWKQVAGLGADPREGTPGCVHHPSLYLLARPAFPTVEQF